MNSKKKLVLKLILIGIVATISRIIGQLLIPQGTQTILEPSVLVKNGIMPVAFTIYGTIVYAILAGIFLFIKDGISGRRIVRGLKYSLTCCLIWIAYLQEPLPHVAFIDKFTYPIADSIALIVMGLCIGLLLCEKQKVVGEKNMIINYQMMSVMTAFFFIGRFLQYQVINIYSNYKTDRGSTLLWVVITGEIISLVMQWFNEKLQINGKYMRTVILGCVIFGVDLLMFNFFMPLIFNADIPDLLVRTFIDIASVTLGCFCLQKVKF